MKLTTAGILVVLMVAADQRPANAGFRSAFDPEQVANSSSPASRNLGRNSLVVDGTGNVFAVWSQTSSADWSTSSIFAQRMDRLGARIGSEIAVATFEANRRLVNEELIVRGRPNGGFIVSWAEFQADVYDTPYSVQARIFDGSGTPLGAGITVSGASGFISSPASPQGNILLVLTRVSSTTDSDVFVRMFDATGTPLSDEVPLNIDTSDFQTASAVAPFGEGRFLVTWSHTHDNFDDGAVLVKSWDTYARVVGSDGQPVGFPFMVANTDDGGEFGQAILPLSSGNLLVLFSRHFGTNDGIYAREFDSSGVARGDEFRIPWPHEEGYTCIPTRDSYVIDGNDVLGGACMSYSYPAASLYEKAYLITFDLASRTPGSPVMLRRDMIGNEADAAVAGDPLGGFLVTVKRMLPQTPTSELVFRRACDTADADCDLCVGYDDNPDADEDGVPDGCDPCDAPSFPETFSDPFLDLRFVGIGTRDAARGGNRLDLRSTTDLPLDFATLDPVTNGMRLLIETTSNGLVMDLTLPGGAFGGSGTRGWKAKADGTRWTFLDRTTEPEWGIRSVMLSSVPSIGPSMAKFRVSAKNEAYVVEDLSGGLRMTLFPSGSAAGEAGICIQHTFPDESCVGSAQSRTTCEE